MLYKILGSLEISTEEGVPARGPKVRQLLGLLLVSSGKIVSVDSIIDELWGDAPPPTAVETVRTHVFHLRRTLNARSGGTGGNSVHTRSSGYLFSLSPEQLDLAVFDRARQQGQVLLREHRYEEAIERFDHALELWRGPLLCDIPHGRLLDAHEARISDARTRVGELRIEAAMALGLYRDVVGELRDHVSADPLNEWFHARLIDALHRSGRRGEALRAYRTLRDLLHAELGLEPSAEVQRLQQRILTS